MAAIKLKVLHYYYHFVSSFTATSEQAMITGFKTQILWSSICTIFDIILS